MFYRAGENPGEYIAVTPDEILTEAAKVALRKLRKGMPLTAPEKTRKYLQTLYSQRESEVFGMILLDNQHRIINTVELFTGTIDGAAVYPREVVKTVLEHNAAAVLLFHNHPSGIATPSEADVNITTRIKQALETIDVRVLDHIVVGYEGSHSFAEHGKL